MTEKYDPFYFSRSDLSDDEKLRIMNERLTMSVAESDKGHKSNLDDVINQLVVKYSAMMKQAS